ncbi:hypothetical protein [Bifidobacterium felsineum]|uniref:hypothetical protein n=1 Tax=Bifidobacterium felsineum TaxID=2045440 RepID=UPI001BDC64D6|nr:hypothetical protein [Bifidobacterium felsineum]MBT1164606.1 hypothetical protein [Bifidobacterium felsineum]
MDAKTIIDNQIRSMEGRLDMLRERLDEEREYGYPGRCMEIIDQIEDLQLQIGNLRELSMEVR